MKFDNLDTSTRNKPKPNDRRWDGGTHVESRDLPSDTSGMGVSTYGVFSLAGCQSTLCGVNSANGANVSAEVNTYFGSHLYKYEASNFLLERGAKERKRTLCEDSWYSEVLQVETGSTLGRVYSLGII